MAALLMCCHMQGLQCSMDTCLPQADVHAVNRPISLVMACVTAQDRPWVSSDPQVLSHVERPSQQSLLPHSRSG